MCASDHISLTIRTNQHNLTHEPASSIPATEPNLALAGGEGEVLQTLNGEP
jgi:hypothetical protein